ncbi:MAG: flagellar export chaperone FliS [Aquabacterium sp.]|jgi:flagellar protein FliS|nr:MAG: flagellar export chaperone FliS [Aquabacterium sp.]TAL24906.1 MAG: flagellar export chaperone FliS [Aquabacterium sp.]
MFASAFTPRRPQPYSPAALSGLYRTVGLETAVSGADPHGLVTMLFDGLVDAMSIAKTALREGQIEAKGKAIGRAVRIIEEGLKAGLNMEAGGQLAVNLRDLYGYVELQLTRANLRNDPAVIDECIRLIEPLRDAWKAIGPEVARMRAVEVAA